eukprot:SAG31_NODE_3877_length_3791_cov_45.339382_3_plen_321_part_00
MRDDAGHTVRPGKKIKVTVPVDMVLHITQAALGADAKEGRHVLMVHDPENGDSAENDTAVCALSLRGMDCFMFEMYIHDETLEFYHKGPSTIFLTGYTVDEAEDDDEQQGDTNDESISQLPSDEETEAIRNSAEAGEADDDGDEDEDEDDGEFSDEDGESSDEEEDDDDSEPSEDEPTKAKAKKSAAAAATASAKKAKTVEASSTKRTKAKSEDKPSETSSAAAKSEKKKRSSEDPAPAPGSAKKAKADVSSTQGKASSTANVKLNASTPEGAAALKQWHEQCLKFVKENPGVKLTKLGQAFPAVCAMHAHCYVLHSKCY